MKRRVNLIAGILHRPSIVFLDEPTVGVDVQSRSVIIEYLKNLNEHYEKWIASYKHRLLIIDVNNLDYVTRIEDFAFVVSKIDYELNNLFS